MGGLLDIGPDSGRTIVCIACGETLQRGEAREYDKYGDRWERHGKDFEYLCKPCDKARSQHSREGLEAMLVDIGAGESDQATFLRAFLGHCEHGEPKS